jgi:hypothetical protein
VETLAITLKAEGILNRIITPVTVRQAEQFCINYGFEVKPAEARGMWDTGSTGCCISQTLAEYLDLTTVDSWSLTSVHGSKPSKVYFLDIILPDKITIANIPVVEIDTGQQYDLIIGMNIISLGDFAISNNGGNTVMSFRLPASKIPIDFSKDE